MINLNYVSFSLLFLLVFLCFSLTGVGFVSDDCMEDPKQVELEPRRRYVIKGLRFNQKRIKNMNSDFRASLGEI